MNSQKRMRKALTSARRLLMLSRRQSARHLCTYPTVLGMKELPLIRHRLPNESNPQPQFKLDIRNAPIQEEDGDADAALANMANTLRAVRRLCGNCLT
jgi:hypothetical protein